METRQDALCQALAEEQARVSFLYGRLDEAREHAQQALTRIYAGGGRGGTAQARVEREVGAAEQGRRLAQLRAVERGLCFGRIDEREGPATYVGRIGLRDGEHESVLIDWRAPAARPFYVATATDPGTLVRRRHLHLRERSVVGIDDEVFDLDGLSEGDRSGLVGEAALLAALRRGRTGRMGDVVATIQVEQDRVIRAGLQGALVVQGGPGTGKTVAALHRAAYLLYTHRDTLERRGVLVVGPNPMFLRYISQVLPALGETQVVMRTVGELFPGVLATAADTPAAAVVKGDERMAQVLSRALRERQRVPAGDLEVVVDGVRMVVPHATCAALRERARAVRLPHNMARKLYVTELLKELAVAEARAVEASLRLEEIDFGEPELNEPIDLHKDLDEVDLALAADRLWAEPAVRRAVGELWPELTPQQLVGDLLADPDTLWAVCPPGVDWEAVVRPAGSPWTVEDVPLLDEAAELLGQDDSAERVAGRREQEDWQEQQLYAQEVLEATGLVEQGIYVAGADLAERQAGLGSDLTTADRAAADRSWAYGHVIVDEAQELSAMAWRAVMRRVPAKSLTVVGDLAQTGSAAGARSWGQVLDPHLAGRWREERLLVNYRTPAEIMRVAEAVLHSFDPGALVPESVREGEAAPRAVRGDLGVLAAVVAEELAAIGEGQVGVIVPDELHQQVRGDLEERVVVLTVTGSKGLEFDAVVVVEPGLMAPRDLYVAVTRATRRLTVLHEDDLPQSLKSTL